MNKNKQGKFTLMFGLALASNIISFATIVAMNFDHIFRRMVDCTERMIISYIIFCTIYFLLTRKYFSKFGLLGKSVCSGLAPYVSSSLSYTLCRITSHHRTCCYKGPLYELMFSAVTYIVFYGYIITLINVAVIILADGFTRNYCYK